MTVEAFILIVLAAAASAAAASYVTTGVIRSGRAEQSVAGRSRCDHCQVELSYAQTTPVLSYVLQSGACSTCHAPIDPTHPFGEAAGAVIGVCAALLVMRSVGLGLILEGLGLGLLALSVHDVRTLKLPNPLVALIAACAAGLALMQGAAVLATHLLWAAGTFSVLAILRQAFALAKGTSGLGFGDVKLLAALALWLGPLTPSALVLACLLALGARAFTGSLAGKAPFGPWIGIGAWVIGVGAQVVPWSP